jgi:DNA-directed RNA polymerase specialized sigma24 family protein
MSLRTSHNDPEVPFDELGNDDGEIDGQSQFGKGDSRLHGSLDRVLLERAIQLLPPGYRIVFILHDVEGYEHNEIAEILGCSIGNSKSQLHKARLKLRKCLHAGNGNFSAERSLAWRNDGYEEHRRIHAKPSNLPPTAEREPSICFL